MATFFILRTPLRMTETPGEKGTETFTEPIYSLGNIDQGIHEDGVFVGKEKPLLHSQLPTIRPDGILQWEVLDTPANRDLARSLLPQIPNPPFTYWFESPVQDGEAEPQKRSAGRPRKVFEAA